MPFLSNQASRFIGGGRVPPAPVPVAGAELIVNGIFSAWTGDNPDGWIVGGTETGTVYVRENAGRAELATDGTIITINQTILTVGLWYIAGIGVISATGSIGLLVGATNPQYALFAAGQVLATSRATEANFQIKRLGGAATAIFDNVTCKLLSLASLISTRPYASADIDISAAVTRTAGTQAGFAVRVDDPANPQNFIISYLDGVSGIKTDKVVAGVYSNIAGLSGAVTYVAGQRPRIVCAGNDVSVYYNGIQVGSTTAIADAGIASNKNHGLFSTYAANTFSGYTAA